MMLQDPVKYKPHMPWDPARPLLNLCPRQIHVAPKEVNTRVFTLALFVIIFSCMRVCPTLCDIMDCSLPVPLSIGFTRQDYWSGLPFPPPPGDLPDPGIEPSSPAAPALQADSLPVSHRESPYILLHFLIL